MYKNVFVLNNQQWLMCYKTESNQAKPINIIYFDFFEKYALFF